MRRFFTDPLAPDCTRTLLDQDESRHLRHVLRVSAGEKIELIDGHGMRYSGTVEQLGKQVAVAIGSRRKEKDDSAPIIVSQGDLKGGKIDFLVEKCTELGVRTFIPFTAGRSQGRIDAARRERRRARHESIVKSASKQCGRFYFMQIEPEMTFEELIGLGCDPACRKIMLWEKADGVTLSDVIGEDQLSPVYLTIGPEGGFSAEEAARARAAGWRQVSLGPRILRAETAAVAAVAVVNHLLGRF
jgi:16S rRNA (uracil1498-N3)-methyltransferase